jgi:hypothetical protein
MNNSKQLVTPSRTSYPHMTDGAQALLLAIINGTASSIRSMSATYPDFDVTSYLTAPVNHADLAVALVRSDDPSPCLQVLLEFGFDPKLTNLTGSLLHVAIALRADRLLAALLKYDATRQELLDEDSNSPFNWSHYVKVILP